MLKLANAARRKERAAKNKPNRPNKVLAGLRQAIEHQAGDKTQPAPAFTGQSTAQQETPATGELKLSDTDRALYADGFANGAREQMQTTHDDIVCSLISMVQHETMPRHAPWTVSAAEMRALLEVLERAGYTATGKHGVSDVRNAA